MKQPFALARTIHAALCAGPTMFVAALYYVRQINQPPAAPEQNLIAYVLLGAGAVALAAGQVIPPAQALRANVAALRQAGPLQGLALMARYQTAKIVQWALVEGAALMQAVGFFLTGETVSLVACGVAIGVLAFLRPTPADIRTRLGLTETELRALNLE